MPLTDPRSIIVRGALQNVSIQYRNPMYVADQVFPIIDGLSSKTKVAKYIKGPWFRDEAEPRAPGTAARMGHFKLATSNLDPINYAFGAAVADEERREANVPGNLPIQPDIDALEYIANKLDINKEVRTAALLHETNWGGSSVGGADAAGLWGAATAAADDTMLADLRTGRDAVYALTGLICNTLFLSWPAWSAIQVSKALLALMNPTTLTREALVTLPALTSLIGVKEIIVGTALKITDEETVADTGFTPVNIWGTSGAETKGVAFLYYKPERPGLKTPSAGYQYRVKKENGQGRISTTWRENALHSDAYDTEENTDIAAVGTDCGYMWKDTALT